MSAILSADDLNDFISPGVACIKPVETLPKQRPDADSSNPYEVTTEDSVASGIKEGSAAQISLTDCLACSGCVTSAEAVLVSLQSHQEVLNTLDAYESVVPEILTKAGSVPDDSRIFVASVSPQTRASLAALYSISEQEAGYLIQQLLAGPQGLKSGGRKNSGFTWVVDTNTLREACQAACAEEVLSSISGDTATNGHSQTGPKKPILASACPGWICYAEKTHPHILPHLSRLKSPQALAGIMLKSVLSRRFGIAPDKVWHVAIMPCFDKKLEASREELTDTYWNSNGSETRGVRDVDCVITARELVMLADTRGISLPNLPRTPIKHVPFPDAALDRFLFPQSRRQVRRHPAKVDGSSGGYAYHILRAQQARVPGSEIRTERGRNVDVVEYTLVHEGEVVMKTARYYGFRNIQNLVRRLKPQKKSRMPGSKLATAGRKLDATNGSTGTGGGMTEYAYVEVMACPGGCTNGGGQIKASDVAEMMGTGETGKKIGPAEQKEWLARVDEAYYSAESSSEDELDPMEVDNEGEVTAERASRNECDEREGNVDMILRHWSSSTGIELDKLLFTTYRQVESDVGKDKGNSDMERVAGLASTIGGGW